MNISTVSSKYQIVIPKEIRRKLKIKPGQRMRLRETKSGDIIVNSTSEIEKSYGILRGVWGKNSDSYIQKMREDWDDHT